MNEKSFYVYMMASRIGGTLYIGVTSRLVQRVYEHRIGMVPGFTKTYGVKMLVWYEPHGSADSAIRREKQLKEWKRAWKIQLIEDSNPRWVDLWPELRLG
jgi:putative endonuclease